MRGIGFEDDGGTGADARLFTRTQCFETIMSYDTQTTQLSRAYSMRKALIQTSAYWEMRHYDLIDQGVDHQVASYHLNGIGIVKDSSTGIAQISGEVGIRAWNHCIDQGFVTGTPTDPTKEADIWAMWQKVNKENVLHADCATDPPVGRRGQARRQESAGRRDALTRHELELHRERDFRNHPSLSGLGRPGRGRRRQADGDLPHFRKV
ncbi:MULTISPECIES: hypothetical protein [Streptomyces]|uniref:Uncharacterized protein n=1 Tax=Streptomyces sudanensis TaxID=436397 RepID=A0ABY4TEG7_9ACTN|nr:MULTISPECIES: hypothetical protein [Streptomyces]URN15931.1 hypothetical protein MW084_08180 [Streptomyces sudanensis]